MPTTTLKLAALGRLELPQLIALGHLLPHPNWLLQDASYNALIDCPRVILTLPKLAA